MTTIADGSMWRALMWMLFALAMFSLVAISGREAAREIAEAAGRTTPILSDTLQIMIVRSFVGLVIVSAIIATSEQGFRQITSRNLLLHTGRNTTHYVGQFCWFHALSLIPLSQLFALEFTSPLWVALFAWLLLGERFSAERIAAVVLGFLGILVIVQPGVQSIGLGSGLAMSAAITFALAMIATKSLMGRESALAVLFHMSWMQLLISSVLIGPYLSCQTTEAYAWLVVIGITSTAAHFALARAFKEGDAMIVAPMDFLRLPIITVIGALAYNEAIQPEIAIGAALILSGNALNLWGQHRLSRVRRPS